MSRLRKILPPEIEVTTQPGPYAIGLSPDTLDATRFERLLGESIDAREAGIPALALSLAERALSLWRSRAYGDLAYDEFAHAESERLTVARWNCIRRSFRPTSGQTHSLEGGRRIDLSRSQRV